MTLRMTVSRRRVGAVVLVVTVVLSVGLLGSVVGAALAGDDPPGEHSVDVGFARDMGIHHGQGVELAELARDRTDDEEIRRLAADIALTQHGQIGQMRGWLDTWGRPPSSVEPPMEWMGHAAGEPMPGLASDEEVAALTAATGVEADTLFLELMIRHHQGGLHMAQAAAGTAREPYVRALATGMVESQTAEIGYMTDLLAARGVRYGDPRTPSDG
jgi:uncharacterized protein (DUF305 family)